MGILNHDNLEVYDSEVGKLDYINIKLFLDKRDKCGYAKPFPLYFYIPTISVVPILFYFLVKLKKMANVMRYGMDKGFGTKPTLVAQQKHLSAQ